MWAGPRPQCARRSSFRLGRVGSDRQPGVVSRVAILLPETQMAARTLRLDLLDRLKPMVIREDGKSPPTVVEQETCRQKDGNHRYRDNQPAHGEPGKPHGLVL